MMPSIKEQLSKKIEKIEQTIDFYLPEEKGLQKTVLSAMNYSVKAGGKRLRPMLMAETYEMFGGAEQTKIYRQQRHCRFLQENQEFMV